MSVKKTYIDNNGRLAIPFKIREQLKLKSGDEVTIKCIDEGLLISTFRSNLEKARSILKKHIGEDRNLVDEFLASKKEEVALEEEKYKKYTNKKSKADSQ